MPELVDLNVDWVSVVDRAAMRDPKNAAEPRRLLLWKRDGVTFGQTSNTTGRSTMPSALETLVDRLSKADEETITRFVAALDKAEEPGESKKNPASTTDADADQAGGDAGEAHKADPAEAAKAAKAERKAAKKAQAEQAELSKSEREFRERVEKAERDAAERIQKAEEQSAEAAKIAKAEVERREQGEYVTKAEAYVGLPLNPTSFGPVLRSIDLKLEKAEAEQIHTLLKSADEVIRQSEVFKQLGTELSKAQGDDSPAAELRRKAEELMKSSESPISLEKAEDRVMSMDRELQARYLDSVR